MAVSMRQSLRLGAYLAKRKFARREKFPLVVELEPLFARNLGLLEGKADFQCTAWGIPSYSVFGWRRPCYLMSDGYVQTYKETLRAATGR